MEETSGTLLPKVTLPSDVAALQQAIKADREVLVNALVRCVAAGKFSDDTQPEWDQWQALKVRVLAYLDETPAILSTVSQFERGEALQKEQSGWHETVKRFGCDAGPAPSPISTPSDSPFASFGLGLSSGALLALAALFFMVGKK